MPPQRFRLVFEDIYLTFKQVQNELLVLSIKIHASQYGIFPKLGRRLYPLSVAHTEPLPLILNPLLILFLSSLEEVLLNIPSKYSQAAAFLFF